jgi:hypothetical protein
MDESKKNFDCMDRELPARNRRKPAIRETFQNNTVPLPTGNLPKSIQRE